MAQLPYGNFTVEMTCMSMFRLKQSAQEGVVNCSQLLGY